MVLCLISTARCFPQQRKILTATTQDAYSVNARCLPQQYMFIVVLLFHTVPYKNPKPNLQFLDLKYRILNNRLKK